MAWQILQQNLLASKWIFVSLLALQASLILFVKFSATIELLIKQDIGELRGHTYTQRTASSIQHNVMTKDNLSTSTSDIGPEYAVSHNRLTNSYTLGAPSFGNMALTLKHFNDMVTDARAHMIQRFKAFQQLSS